MPASAPEVPSREDLLARVTALEAECERLRHGAVFGASDRTPPPNEGEELFRKIFEIETVGIIFFDPAGAITRANDAFLRMGGYTQDDVAAGTLSWERLTPPEWMPDSLRAIEQLKTAGSTIPYEKEYYRKDGSRWWGLFAAKGINEQQGVEFILDITDRKQMDAALRDVQERAESARAEAEAANQAKAAFLASMSHELRTPLNAIGGYVDLLDLGVNGSVTEAQREALSRIQVNQRLLLTLINDVLAYAKLEAGRVEFDLQPVSVSGILASIDPITAPLAGAKGIACSVQTCDAALRVSADEERVRQILLNLVANAIKFTSTGGWVVLGCDADEEWVFLHVRDNGPGISPDKQKVVFEAFTQVDRRLDRPEEGVGLGLAISRDLARGMGGELDVESTPGQGSTFTLRLPRAEDGAGSTR